MMARPSENLVMTPVLVLSIVHLAGQKEGVALEANPHGILKTLSLVAMQEVTPELVERRLLCFLTDQTRDRDEGLYVAVSKHYARCPHSGYLHLLLALSVPQQQLG